MQSTLKKDGGGTGLVLFDRVNRVERGFAGKSVEFGLFHNHKVEGQNPYGYGCGKDNQLK